MRINNRLAIIAALGLIASASLPAQMITAPKEQKPEPIPDPEQEARMTKAEKKRQRKAAQRVRIAAKGDKS